MVFAGGAANSGKSLKDEVTQLHEFLFGSANYAPSAKVKEISDEIDAKRGKKGSSKKDSSDDEVTYSAKPHATEKAEVDDSNNDGWSNNTDTTTTNSNNGSDVVVSEPTPTPTPEPTPTPTPEPTPTPTPTPTPVPTPTPTPTPVPTPTPTPVPVVPDDEPEDDPGL